MQVTKHKVVAIDYTLKDDGGDVIDSSEGVEPLHYLHGEGNIVPGLECVLEGKSVGDQLNVTVSPSDGYGERHEELRQTVDRNTFADVDDLATGMQFRVQTEDEQFLVVTVVEVGDDKVVIDGNHELAGVTLHFDVTIRDIRDATSEEISHGHAHGPGGHQH